MVLVMTRHRDWTVLTAAKDAQGRVVKQLQGAKGPTKKQACIVTAYKRVNLLQGLPDSIDTINAMSMVVISSHFPHDFRDNPDTGTHTANTSTIWADIKISK
jgi:Ser-tRNA(Ala) deacylase AlaX